MKQKTSQVCKYPILIPVNLQLNFQNSESTEPTSRDVGIQTILRESETQTLPYTPKEYVLPGTFPEVLKISHFKYGKQLPPTLGNGLIKR